MRARQARQRAPSQAHETSGTLSYQTIGVAQRGQREPGRTIDSSAGSRWMHTFRKLPMQVPAVKTSTKSGQSAAAAAGSSIPEMTWVNGYPAWWDGSNAAQENRRGTDRWSVPRRSYG